MLLQENMKDHIVIFNPNNTAFICLIFIFLGLVLYTSLHLLDHFSWLLFTFNLINCLALFVISIVVKMNRKIIILNNIIYLYFFHKIIPISLKEFKVSKQLKKGQLQLFIFESDKLKVKIYPKTYKKPENLMKVIDKIIQAEQS